MDRIDLTHDGDRWGAFVNAVMNLRIPWNTSNFFTIWGPSGFWRTVLGGLCTLVCILLNTM